MRSAPRSAALLRFALVLSIAFAGAFVATPALAAELSAQINVTTINPMILTPGDRLTISGTILNTGDRPIEAAEVDLQLSEDPAPLRDRGLLAAWQADRTVDTWGWNAFAVKLPRPIPPGGSEPFTLSIDASRLPQSKQKAGGAFPCRLDLATARGVVTVLRTFIVWQPTTDIAPVTISTLVPVLATPQRSADGQSLTGAADPASIDRATRLIADGANSPIDWLLDPALVQGGAKDAPTARLVAALQSSQDRHDLFRLPWADVDVAAIAAAGTPGLYEAAAEDSRRALAQHKLSDGGLIVWPPFGRIDSATVSMLSDQGAPRAVALASSPLETYPMQNKATSPRATIVDGDGSVPGLVSDDTLTALMSQSDSAQPLERQRLVAELAMIADLNPGHTKSVFLLPDRAWADHFEQLETNLTMVSTLPWVRTSRTSSLVAGSAGLQTEAGEATTAGGAMAPSLVDRLDASLSSAQVYASVTEQPAATLAPMAHRLLFPLAVTLRDQPTAREGFALAAIDQTARTSQTISVKQGSNINLVAQSGMMPVAVTNSGDQPVTVTVKLESPDRRLIVPDTKVLTVKSGSEERALLKIEAVTSGDVQLQVLALNKAGQEVADRSTMTIRVRADWEDVGTLIVGILFAGLLVVGLVRSSRRKRADRMKATSEQ